MAGAKKTQRGKENASMMKRLVGNIVSIFTEIAMWITLIACAGGGVYLGYKVADLGIAGAIGGFVLGVIVGLWTNTMWWMVSAFQEIRNYLKEIAERE
jgi:fatty acid desaturase